MASAYLQGESTKMTRLAVSRTQGEATGTMVPVHPQGGATGTLVPAHPQGNTSLVQVQEQIIGKVKFSVSGGETNVVGHNNTIIINKMADETTITQNTLQWPSGNKSTGKESNSSHDKSGAKRKNSEEAAGATITKFVYDSKEVLVERREGIKAVLQRLKDYNMAVITGVTGEGKTTLAAQILIALRNGKLDSSIESKIPLQIFIPEDWTDLVDANEDTVVFVDDLFGTSNYQVDLLNRWKPIFSRINQCLEQKKVMLLLTSRTHILTDARRDAGVIDGHIDHILSEKKVVDLTYKYQLTPEEQKTMVGNYSVLNKREDDFKYRISSRTQNRSIGFPQVCSLFFNDTQLYEKGEKFFENPDILLANEIEKMRNCEPNKYFALVYCFLQPRQGVDSRDLDPLTMPEDKKKMLKVFAEVCGVDSNNQIAVLKKALSSLTRTYLSKHDTVYTFSHESVAENVCLVFGSENPKLTLQKCSNRVILELLDLSQADQQQTLPRMDVPEACFDELSERIYKMVTEGHLFKWQRLTLASFPRFQNKKFANHFLSIFQNTN